MRAARRREREKRKNEPPKPFMEFTLKYDPWTHKALEYKLDCSKDCCARPHMRAFHLAWTSFLMAFIAWFSFAPLAPVMKKTLGLSQQEILVANITSVLTTVFARFIMGPIMDVIGPRIVQSSLLIFASIPLFFATLINDGASLAVIRGLVGVVGATFVGCQFWTSLMFEQELAGVMNATAAGWGNLGGGLAQLVMVGIYNMNLSAEGCDEECAWRNAFWIPAFVLIGAAGMVMGLGDDGPRPDMFLPPYEQTQLRGYGMANVAGNLQVWVLMVQYAVCFGVELHLNNTVALYFFDRFGLNLTTAGIVASTFGLMNLFARSWGGWTSDYCYAKWGMQGRKVCHVVLTCLEGITLVIFALQGTFGAAVFFLIIFSFFVQGAEGSTFGIVPYVDIANTGAVCGFVGAGGNVGAVIWGAMFLAVNSFQEGYLYLGMIVFVLGLTGWFINVDDQAVNDLKRLTQAKANGAKEAEEVHDPTLDLKAAERGETYARADNPNITPAATPGAKSRVTDTRMETMGSPLQGASSMGSRLQGASTMGTPLQKPRNIETPIHQPRTMHAPPTDA
mmetsp:Transcript_3100/g.6058  ORF Transcript_3100/g.6058 Transcript_3100/m.6058 type:complete len:563 (+) Transcript_3100:127-1815(+)|eukprot:CAMPEP_0167791008 /NCGR_PEP_ID=MMETSP0111_2-20121227/11661_1 /TAXON_ID=91324 /ORGANISM="Lotharella globosa, Strain CCCM811" /LENGTH=562 /DNA_ID=CAMNT_0007683557 /DNA_START=41 /DNA_END=1729 /DNA_ORIENTATION=-